MYENKFLLEDDSYTRNIHPVKEYIYQSAYYLSKHLNKPISECEEIVKKALKDREAFPDIRNPKVIFYQKQDNGDKQLAHCKLTEYINDIIRNREMLAPSFTTYMHPDKIPSMISEFAVSNVTLRSKVKKEMFIEKAKGNKDKAMALDLAQKNYKQYNNALSGALVSGGSVVRNPSGHSSLTSTTRSVTSLGNATNERFIASNRHYRDPDIVMFNIISICSHTDLSLVRSTMEKYHLNYPTIDQAMACIDRSSRYYWVDRVWYDKIKHFLSLLTQEELAAFVYTGDLYQMRLISPEFVTVMLDELSTMKTIDLPIEQVYEIIPQLDESFIITARLICYDDLIGNKAATLKELDEPLLRKVIGTAIHVHETVAKYEQLYKTFFITTNVPPSVAYIADMVRRAVVLSDTDSTCASYGEWVNWRYGKIPISGKGIAYSSGIMTISSNIISHSLKTLSANIGVTKSNLSRLAMKNEFLWSIMAVSSLSKTYFASTLVQEGVIFPEYDLEVKGVMYKSANSPKPVNKLILDIMHYVIDSIMATGEYSLNEILLKGYNLEKRIVEYIDNKDPSALEYFQQLNIKEAQAYALEPHRSNYFHYLLWHEVFEPKYGALTPPPYRSIKIPLDISNKSDLTEWISSIEDKALARRLTDFLLKYKKTDIKLICLPIEYVANNGIPIEIRQRLSITRLLNNVFGGVYVLLDSLGFIKLPTVPYLLSVRK